MPAVLQQRLTWFVFASHSPPRESSHLLSNSAALKADNVRAKFATNVGKKEI